MRIPQKIYEDDKVINFLKKRNLLKQYIKSCNVILSGVQQSSDFKERKPKGSGVRVFRVNKQYRAVGYRRDSNFIVVQIDNHQ